MQYRNSTHSSQSDEYLFIIYTIDINCRILLLFLLLSTRSFEVGEGAISWSGANFWKVLLPPITNVRNWEENERQKRD